MERKLLDSASGHYGDEAWSWEQFWLFGEEYLVRVVVEYVADDMGGSNAHAVLMDADSGCETDIVLRDFPSRWWEAVGGGEEGASEVSESLLSRMAVFLEE